jgi:hypothetical protein
LKLGRIALRSSGGGECGETLLDQVTTLFTEAGVTVIDRENFNALLAEYKINASGMVDPSTAAEMGKMLGVDAVLTLKITRCDTRDPGLISRHPKGLFNIPDTKVNEYVRSVTGSLVGSLRVTDLKTGRMLKAQNANISAARETSSREGPPVPPDPNQVLDELIAKGRLYVHSMFFPWTETVELHFFDDGDYNLKAAYDLFRSGQFEAALAQSQKNLVAADADPKPKTKQLRHAVYNVGMCLYAMERYEEAIPVFQRATTLDAGEYEPAALASCQKAVALKKSFQEYEERTNLAALDDSGAGASARPMPQSPAAPAAAAAPSVSSPAERLKNLDDLLKKGLISKTEYDSMRAAILKEFVK